MLQWFQDMDMAAATSERSRSPGNLAHSKFCSYSSCKTKSIRSSMAYSFQKKRNNQSLQDSTIKTFIYLQGSFRSQWQIENKQFIFLLRYSLYCEEMICFTIALKSGLLIFLFWKNKILVCTYRWHWWCSGVHISKLQW